MTFGLGIIVAIGITCALAIVFPVIPYACGMLVGVLHAVVYPLYYLGASCYLINSFSTLVLSLVGGFLFIKLIKTFKV